MNHFATLLGAFAAVSSCGTAAAWGGSDGSLRGQAFGGFSSPNFMSGKIPLNMRKLQDADSGSTDRENDDVQVSPDSIVQDIPVTYRGPSPSQVQKELIGPYQLLKSGVVDEDAGTVTLPIFKGVVEAPEGDFDGTTGDVWYIVTDTSDGANAAQLGLNHAPKLIYTNVGNGARSAYLGMDTLVHFVGGSVDFSPVQSVEAGSDSAYPPSSTTAGSKGDSYYSPYFVLQNGGGNVYNAPIVSMGAEVSDLQAYCDGVDEGDSDAYKVLHDRVTAICPNDDGLGGTVTLKLSFGYSFARPVSFLSMDASTEEWAAMSEATMAPGMQDIATGGDDTFLSPSERIFVTLNGATNDGDTVHPSRQGMESSLLGEGSPIHVLGGIPTLGTDYSPAWDVNLGEWTQAAIDAGYVDKLLEEFQILGYVELGYLTGPDGAEYGSTSSGGFILNCPIVFRFL